MNPVMTEVAERLKQLHERTTAEREKLASMLNEKEAEATQIERAIDALNGISAVDSRPKRKRRARKRTTASERRNAAQATGTTNTQIEEAPS